MHDMIDDLDLNVLRDPHVHISTLKAREGCYKYYSYHQPAHYWLKQWSLFNCIAHELKHCALLFVDERFTVQWDKVINIDHVDGMYVWHFL